MYGFVGYCGADAFQVNLTTKHKYERAKDYIENQIRCENVVLYQRTINKFAGDKYFYKNEKYMLCVEGCIYNLCELDTVLNNNYTGENANKNNVLISLYEQYGNQFLSRLEGVWSFVLIDLQNSTILLSTDTSAYKPLFYYKSENGIYFSSDIAWLYDSLKENQVNLTLDFNGAYCLLSYGYMLENITLVEGVFKLYAGEYLTYSNGVTLINKYFDVASIKREYSFNKDELLEEANALFCDAVKLIYDKDGAYGYKHLCTLSAGLDSRSVFAVSDKMGYKNKTITMSQTGAIDQIIPLKIAADKKCENVFYSLDNGEFLQLFREVIECNGGLISYTGGGHMLALLDSVNMNQYGAVITGELGDIIFGGHKLNEYKEKSFGDEGAFSSRYVMKVSENLRKIAISRSSSKFDFFYMQRGVNSANNSWYTGAFYTETASPFINRKFIEFMFGKVPPELKNRSKFYIKWIKKYIPEMCTYKWSGSNTKPDASNLAKKIAVINTYCKIYLLKKSLSMNPLDIYISSEKFKNIICSYKANVDALVDNNDLRTDIITLLEYGDATEKLQAITLLTAIERFGILC